MAANLKLLAVANNVNRPMRRTGCGSISVDKRGQTCGALANA